MSYGKYTVVFALPGRRVKLVKIWFGHDGSYYVTCPYHPARTGHLFLRTLNYARPEATSSTHSHMVAQGIVNEDAGRVKLSHHTDGYVQFSGQGVVSGRHADGSPKGIGVHSWPLRRPTLGPSFSLTIVGAHAFESSVRKDSNVVEFTESDLPPVVDGQGIILEGYYFPPEWRRFLLPVPGQVSAWHILLAHPNGPILDLRTVLASHACKLPGFIGLNLFRARTWIEGANSGFILSGSTGNLRRNQDGELLGDGVFCVYPAAIAAIDDGSRLRLPSLVYQQKPF